MEFLLKMGNFDILTATKIVNKKIYGDGNSAALLYNDVNALHQLNVSDYLANKSKCVVTFLKRSSGITFDKERAAQFKYRKRKTP